MKKFFKTIASFFAALLMVFGLASCDKSGSIKKAYEKADYKVEVVDTNNSLVKGMLSEMLTEDQMKDAEKYEVIYASKGLTNMAIVMKFPSSGDVKDFYTVEDKDGKKDTSAYDKAKEDGNIKGNCVLFVSTGDAKDIFKKA